jgi:RNA polymerase sigma-70 factor (ECF subfamily)
MKGGVMYDIHDLSDEKLMQMCGQGDSNAFGILFHRHKRKILNFAWRYLNDIHSAEDVLQKTFLRMLLFRKSFRSKASFATWLYTIAKNLCWEESKKLRREAQALNGDPGQREHQQPDPLEELERKELQESVREAIAALPPRQRMAIILTKYQGMSLSEAATVLDCSEGAVKQIIHRSFPALRKKLALYIKS